MVKISNKLSRENSKPALKNRTRNVQKILFFATEYRTNKNKTQKKEQPKLPFFNILTMTKKPLKTGFYSNITPVH